MALALITEKSLDDYSPNENVPITWVAMNTGETKKENPTKAQITEALEEFKPMTILHQIDFCSKVREHIEETARQKIMEVYQIMGLSATL